MKHVWLIVAENRLDFEEYIETILDSYVNNKQNITMYRGNGKVIMNGFRYYHVRDARGLRGMRRDLSTILFLDSAKWLPEIDLIRAYAKTWG